MKDAFLYCGAGSAVRGEGSGTTYEVWAFCIYAVDDDEADHLALEKLKIAAPAKDGWRELNARVLRAPFEEERVLAMVLSPYRPEQCVRPKGCTTPKTCDTLGCRHAAYRGVRPTER